MFRLALASVLLTGVLCIYNLKQTDWDAPFTRVCNPGDMLKRLVSEHNNHKEDRRWTYGCEKSPYCLAETGTFTGYVNQYDGKMDFKCGDDAVVTGVESVHDNHKEDRRYKFRCTKMLYGKKLTNCQVSGYINDWDKPMAATVPAGAILRGFQSEHNNHKEDRRWKMVTCK